MGNYYDTSGMQYIIICVYIYNTSANVDRSQQYFVNVAIYESLTIRNFFVYAMLYTQALRKFIVRKFNLRNLFNTKISRSTVYIAYPK